jgi:hypothetical protein
MVPHRLPVDRLFSHHARKEIAEKEDPVRADGEEDRVLAVELAEQDDDRRFMWRLVRRRLLRQVVRRS